MISQKNKIIVIILMTMIFGCVSSSGGDKSNNAAHFSGHHEVVKSGPAHDSLIRRIELAELRDLFSNRTQRGVTPSGQAWVVNLQLPNQAVISWTNRFEKGEDKGIWHIEGDRICIKWEKLYNDEKNCMTVYSLSQGQYNLFQENGQIFSHMILD